MRTRVAPVGPLGAAEGSLAPVAGKALSEVRNGEGSVRVNGFGVNSGAIQALVSAGVFAWGIVKGVNPLVATGVILFAHNVGLLAMQRAWRRRDDSKEPQGGFPLPTLAERCHVLAGSIERWVQAYEREQGTRVEKMVEEILEVDPTIDPAEARRNAYSRYDKNWQADYAIKFRTEAKVLFNRANELHEIEAKDERRALRPLAIEFSSVPNLFNKIADSIYSKEDGSLHE